jgi:chemotaxis protein methyltransferase WspC
MKHAVKLAAAMGEIAERLERAAGMDRQRLETAHLQWIIAARCRVLGLDEVAAYAERLADPAEMEWLVDAAVVQETRFFRDAGVFQHLRRTAAELAASAPEGLRILSAPSSTGQEAYSLAATLLQAGVPLEGFRIDAFDVSRSALQVGAAGRYPRAALRAVTAEQQHLCGTLDGDHWQMHPAVRERIRFERRNLAERGSLTEGYHLILCRNLFIYLAPAARAVLAESLAGALLPEGRLVVGTADFVEELAEHFEQVPPAGAFAFRYRRSPAVDHPPRPAGPVVLRQETVARPGPQRVSVLPVATQAEPPLSAGRLHERALEHLDRGSIMWAERYCRQALYLEPRHLPALELLERLWRHQPNLRLRRALEARIVRRRAELSHARKETA